MTLNENKEKYLDEKPLTSRLSVLSRRDILESSGRLRNYSKDFEV
jgi:hypothetical protein